MCVVFSVKKRGEKIFFRKKTTFLKGEKITDATTEADKQSCLGHGSNIRLERRKREILEHFHISKNVVLENT